PSFDGEPLPLEDAAGRVEVEAEEEVDSLSDLPVGIFRRCRRRVQFRIGAINVFPQLAIDLARHAQPVGPLPRRPSAQTVAVAQSVMITILSEPDRGDHLGPPRPVRRLAQVGNARQQVNRPRSQLVVVLQPQLALGAVRAKVLLVDRPSWHAYPGVDEKLVLEPAYAVDGAEDSQL